MILLSAMAEQKKSKTPRRPIAMKETTIPKNRDIKRVHVETVQLGPLARGEQSQRPNPDPSRIPPRGDTTHARHSTDGMHRRIDTIQAKEPRSRATFYVVAAAIVLCAGLLFALLHAVLSEPPTDESTAVSMSAVQDTPIDMEATAIAVRNISPLDLQSIPDSSAPSTFSLTGSNAPCLTGDAYTSIELALLPYAEADVPAGFLLLDCSTGKGIARNIDESIYGASSFKALYCSYVCQTQVETGLFALDDVIPSYAQDDYESYWINGYDTLEDLMFDSIVYSSNGAFGSLRDAFDGDAFDTWLADQGIDASTFGDEWFPYLTVRQAAAMWADTYEYLNTQTETAAWLDDLLANTEVSFIRETLVETEEVVIVDKAGWYADGGWSNYNSVCDSGIVTIDGRDYLLSVMTAAAWSDESVEDFEELTDAVLSARGILA